MKVGRLLKYESREVCTTRLHEESFASYLAISISAKYLAQTVGGDFIILVEWLVLNGNGSASNRFRAFLLELFCPPYTIRRNLFVSQRIEEIEEENRFWNASIRRKELYDEWTTSSGKIFFEFSWLKKSSHAQERNSATPGSFGQTDYTYSGKPNILSQSKYKPIIDPPV